MLRTLLAPLRAPKKSPPFCVVLLALIGRPRAGFQIAFSCHIQIHGGVAGLVLISSVSSYSLCFCFCLDQEPPSHTPTHARARTPVCCSLARLLICCVPGPNSLLSFVSPSPPPHPAVSSRYPHVIPIRHAASLLATASRRPRHRPTPASRPSSATTTRWVNHG